jgi:hypothetical protein
MLTKTGLRTGILSDFNIPLTRNKDWRVTNRKGITHLEKAFERESIFYDSHYFIEDFLNCLYEFPYSSILCGGLGLGIAPYLSQPFCDTIDVIEQDQDLIDLISGLGYLSSKVNIIQGNIFEYEPQRKYDFILIDIWQKNNGTFDTEVETLKNKYTSHLNESGTMCIPLDYLVGKPCNC